VKSMKSFKAILIATVVLGVAGIAHSDTDKHGKGALAVDPAAYAKFKSVGRHRAWLKPQVDLTDRFPLPGDNSKQTPSAGSSAVNQALSFFEREKTGRRPETTAELVSPAYIFYRVRDQKNNCVRSGSNLASALELLKTEGAVSLAEFPYGAKTCLTAPTEGQIQSAGRWRIGDWRAIQREKPDDWRTPIVLDDVKAQLQQRLPVVFTMDTPKSFDDWRGAGVYRTSEKGGGLHAMTLIGYDEEKQAFRILNSWGRMWGDNGYAWIDYGTFASLVMEAYVMEPPGETAPPPPPPRITPENLTKVVGGLECSRVNVRSDGQRRIVEGFAGDAVSYERIRTSLTSEAGVEWNVTYRPWPQCETQISLESALVSDSAQIVLRNEAGQAMAGDPVAMKADDIFSIEATTTADRPYMHVIYLQADGSAVELYRGVPQAGADGVRRVVLGAAGKKERRFQVAPPYGNEVLIVVTSDKPLLEPLQTPQTERQFLTRMRAALADARAQLRPISADIARLRTVEG
jgi:hypothetical protein